MWSVRTGAAVEELEIQASLTGTRSNFMSAKSLTKHRGRARIAGGKACADAYLIYAATFEVGQAIVEHRPDARAWLDARAPWRAEPVYDPNKRGQVIVDGKARLILRNANDALQFKLTFA